jgi:photosystem II stability/assembly factor-like uncharacterized protein/uncharacterized protein YkwD
MRRARLLVYTLLFIVFSATPASDGSVVASALPSLPTEPTAPVLYQWEALALPVNLADAPMTALAVDPADAETVYLATWAGLYKTTTAGQSWRRLAAETLSYVPAMALAQSNPQLSFAASWGPALYRSQDGGENWTPIPAPPSVCGIYIAPSDANRIYVRGCSGGPAIFRSDDRGQTWITPAPTFTNTLDVLAISPTDSNTLIGADFDEVFRSADGGATWSKAAFGTRYFGRPVFDPLPPYVLYLGHWTGLLRSQDGGLNWHESGLAREFSAVVASPYLAGEVLGGDDALSWRILSSGNSWKASSWNAPLPLQELWRSVNDGHVLYAKSKSGMWRYVSTNPSLTKRVSLPDALSSPAESFPTPARLALDQMNRYRAQVGVPPLQLHAAIVNAAQNHAHYHMLNYADSAAWANGPHGEVAGKPGFTGVWPSDRIVAAGYPRESPWWSGSEVMHFIGDPVISVDGWMATIYHRVIPLSPDARYTGYGVGKSNNTAVDVMDFGGGPTQEGMWASATPYPLAYPPDGLTDVPTTWGGGEAPDPLPPGAARPVGYPFTLQGVGGTLHVDSAALRGPQGQFVATHPNPPDCVTFNCFALIAVQPLQSNTVYTVRVQGNVGGVPFDRTWHFTTGSRSATAWPGDPGSIERIGPPYQGHSSSDPTRPDGGD